MAKIKRRVETERVAQDFRGTVSRQVLVHVLLLTKNPKIFENIVVF